MDYLFHYQAKISPVARITKALRHRCQTSA
jgi:hypothetical protein